MHLAKGKSIPRARGGRGGGGKNVSKQRAHLCRNMEGLLSLLVLAANICTIPVWHDRAAFNTTSRYIRHGHQYNIHSHSEELPIQRVNLAVTKHPLHANV